MTVSGQLSPGQIPLRVRVGFSVRVKDLGRVIKFGLGVGVG